MKNNKSKNTVDLPDYPEGTLVTLLVGGEDVMGVFSHWTKLNEAYIKVNGKPYWRKSSGFNVTDKQITTSVEMSSSNKENGDLPVTVMNFKPAKEFDINKRFEFLSSLTRMVLRKELLSLLVTGDGGLGKTFTVSGECDKMNLVEYHNANGALIADDEEESEEDTEIEEKPYDYVIVKGYSTPRGLYNTLYKHQDKLIIFDDCDSVLTNDLAVNMLKGALDSYDKRVISWISAAPLEGIPNRFEFMGRVIFISNKRRSQLPQPLISRATSIDVSMSIDEKITRMRNILPKLRKDLSMDLKNECLGILEKYKNDAKDLNFRTLNKVISIMTSDEADKKELAEYMVLS